MARLAPGRPCPKAGCSGKLVSHLGGLSLGPGVLTCSSYPMPSAKQRLRLALEDKPLPEFHAFYSWAVEGSASGSYP